MQAKTSNRLQTPTNQLTNEFQMQTNNSNRKYNKLLSKIQGFYHIAFCNLVAHIPFSFYTVPAKKISDMENPASEAVTSNNVIDMITVANEFCLFIEKIPDYSNEDIIEYLRKIIPLLYIKGCILPVVQVSDESANERFLTEEQWEQAFNDLRKVFGDKEIYWYIDNSDPQDNDPIKASLAENFADVYQDMKDFLLLYQKNTQAARENAVNECKNLFENHWGYRLVNALKTLHHLTFQDNVIDEL